MDHPWLIKTVLASTVSVMLAVPAPAQTVGPDYPVPPSIEYGELYRDVELAAIFPDSKTFPDMIPSTAPPDVLMAYEVAKISTGFDLANFVNQYFSGPIHPDRPSIRPPAISTCWVTSRACGRFCGRYRCRFRPIQRCCPCPIPM